MTLRPLTRAISSAVVPGARRLRADIPSLVTKRDCLRMMGHLALVNRLRGRALHCYVEVFRRLENALVCDSTGHAREEFTLCSVTGFNIPTYAVNCPRARCIKDFRSFRSTFFTSQWQNQMLSNPDRALATSISLFRRYWALPLSCSSNFSHNHTQVLNR